MTKLKYESVFCKVDDPFTTVEWEKRTAKIINNKGETVFELKDVECPKTWSQMALNVVASKYFYADKGSAKETSVKALISRVVGSIASWGYEDGYFESLEASGAFQRDLAWLLLHQYGAFNSPVWFNVGIAEFYPAAATDGDGGYHLNKTTGTIIQSKKNYVHPQASACQPYYSRVCTPTGLIPIGDIVTKNMIGLSVYDSKGRTKVINVKANGIKPVSRFHLHGNISMDVTGDHLLWDGCKYKPANKFKPGDRLYWYRKNPVIERTSTQQNLAEAALVGWLLTDGCVGYYKQTRGSSYVIEFFTLGDDEYNWLLPHVELVFPGHRNVIEAKTATGITYRRIRLYGNDRLLPFITKWNLLVRDPDIKFPTYFYTAPLDELVMFLSSVFQADGYVSLRDSAAFIGMQTSSYDLMDGIRKVLLRLGIYSKLVVKPDTRLNRHTGYCINIANWDDRNVFKTHIAFISADKQTKLIKSLALSAKVVGAGYKKLVIKEIEDIGTMPVYDIQTESGEYLSEGFRIHNCFIQSIRDDMGSIMELATAEAVLFKHGSGTGTDLSSLRSTHESVAGGGNASGPLSFLKIYDTVAGVVRSGGRIRRSAKMNTLSISHPDIKEWIHAKVNEEKKAKTLINGGYSAEFGGEAYSSVMYQNENLSVKITDEFMEAVEKDEKWETKLITNPSKAGPAYMAKELFRWIAECAHACGDPGIQFNDAINAWNTCAVSGPINCSNPCSEFVFLDDSACNLASLNLAKFRLAVDGQATFDFDRFRWAVRAFTIAQDILIDRASYPTAKIAENSVSYRPLGLGYANLGALLMSFGFSYGSTKGRDFAALITSALTGFAYHASAEIAKVKGPFKHFEKNKECMHKVLKRHWRAAQKLHGKTQTTINAIWQEVMDASEETGFRNAQVTLLAPTGTIGFMMDCDTTGIEPDIALVKYKNLVGGGTVKIVNNTVPVALEYLGYTPEQIKAVVDHVVREGTIETTNIIKPEHIAIFDCAYKPEKGTRFLKWEDHVNMMAAVQPLLSGAISKTVNLANDVSIDTIMQVYMTAWKKGLKGITIYRDGCKDNQPLNLSAKKKIDETKLRRHKLPETRDAKIHKFNVGGHKGYFTVGLYANGEPGELFINISKEGSTVGGLMDAFGTAISLCLQYGVPLKTLVNKFMLSRFEPSGMTGNKEIPMATSLIDYIFRWLDLKYAREVKDDHVKDDKKHTAIKVPADFVMVAADSASSGMICDNCGSITVRSGTCFKCTNCGNSLGCS